MSNGEGGEGPIRPIKDKVLAATTAVVVGTASGLSFPAAPIIERPVETSHTRIVKETEQKTVTDKWGEFYARLFAADPKAGKLVDPADVGKTFTQIDDMLKKGYQIDSISDLGSASDEDDNTNAAGIRTGGLGEKSHADLKLGHKRATVFKRLLDKIYEDHGLTPPDIEISARQDVLHEGPIKEIQDLAQHEGLSVIDLLDKYNGIDGDLPPGSEHVHSVLDRLLQSQRYVEIKFKGIKVKDVPITVTHKIPVPLIWFLSIGVIPEGPKLPKTKQTDNFPDPKIKAHKGYGRVQNLRKQPRPQSEGPQQKGLHAIARDHGGNRGRPTNPKFHGSRRGN